MLLLEQQKTARIIQVVFFLALDRFLKMLALNLPPAAVYGIFGDWLVFRPLKNYFISLFLSLGKSLGLGLAALIILALLFYCQRYWGQMSGREQLAWLLVLAGAFSNLYDRLAYGFVVDYFGFKYLFTNNLADILIFSGLALLVFVSLGRPRTPF